MNETAIVTERAEFVETARSAPDGARVPVELRVTVTDPFEAYRRARNGAHDGVYLETTGGQSGWGYFAVDPAERLQVGPQATTRNGASPSIAAIDGLLDRERLVRGDCDVPYPCGAFGWLSYDIARELEDLPETTTSDGLPRLQLGVFDRVAAWEEPRDGEVELRITACPVIEESPTAAYDDGLNRARSLAEAALHGDRSVQ